MFGIVPYTIEAVSCLKAYQEEAKRFHELCKTLPEDKANELKALRKRQQEENLKHQRALEVARESRTLNFWGER